MDKIRFIKAEIVKRNLPTLIEIDGGVNADNAAELFAAGADVLVAGSAVFGAKDPEEVIRKMKITE
jgi:ribulose-phosphate 3-epimerase